MFPDTEVKVVGGLTCKAKSFKRNLGAYKDIGAKLIIRASRKTIRQKGTQVFLANYYFMKDTFAPGASAQLIEWTGNPGTDETVDKKRTRHKHYVIGLFVKLNAEGITGAGVLKIDLPLVGVVSQARVIVGTKSDVFITQKGSVPVGFAPPLATFRKARLSVLNVLDHAKGLTPPISLRRDVFELPPFLPILTLSLKQQLLRLGPKPREGEFNYQRAYFLMGISDLAYRLDPNPNAGPNLKIRGSLRTTPPASDLDIFHRVEIRRLDDSHLGRLLRNSQYLIVQNGHGDIVVTFRGSEAAQADPPTRELLSRELGAAHATYRHIPVSNGRPNRVHAGIYGAYQSLEQQLETTLRGLLKRNKHPAPHLYFAGHSLGGALATLAALDFVVKRDELEIPEFRGVFTSMYSFGSPRVLDTNTFSNLYQSKLAEAYVVVRQGDPLPALPPIQSDVSSQFIHAGHVVVLDDNLIKMTSISFDPDESPANVTIHPMRSVDFDRPFVGIGIDALLKNLPNHAVSVLQMNDRQWYHRSLGQLCAFLDFDDDAEDFDDDAEDVEDVELSLTL